ITARLFPEVKTLGFDHDDYEDRVDYHVRSAFRNGSLLKEDLYKTFLGMLAIDAETSHQWLAELLKEPDQIATVAEVQV
ncbi:MAG: hypothetical protein AB1489_15530, partial [Acidobacteriota bacterium]